MTEHDWHTTATITLFVLAALTVTAVAFIIAPYGRHERPGWGPKIPARLGWLVMESPASLLFAWIFFQGENRFEPVPLVFLAVWELHYLHRTFLFPFRMRAAGKTMPVLLVGMAIAFNCLNAYVNARWISHLGHYDVSWLWDPRCIAGVLLFLAGFAVNFKADSMLMRLRREGESGYRIPRGWLYERISCPNYFGEILEWTGWALATWSWAGLAFAVYTAANIGPRALQHHAWYGETFPDYPRERKALIPFVL